MSERILMFPEDLARELLIARATARRRMREYGRPVRVGRRTAILREDFLKALRRRQGRRSAPDRSRDAQGRFSEDGEA